jgi:O-antigen/teichoic acid export membrane protein
MFIKPFKSLIYSQLRKNMLSGVISNIISTIILLLGYPLFLHYLGFELYGIWLALSSVMTFARIGDMGIGLAIVKLVAEEYGRNNYRKIQQYVASGLVFLCATGILMVIFILIFKGTIIAYLNLSEEHANIASWLFPYIGILSIYVLMTQNLQGALAGLGRLDLANYIRAAEPAIKVTIAVSLFATGYGIESMLIGSIVSYIFMHICCLFFIRRIANVRIFKPGNFKIQYIIRILKFGGTIMGGSAIGMITKPLINVLLSRYAGVASLPVFEIAYQGTMKVRGLFATALYALMPEFSKLSSMAEDGHLRIRQLYMRSIKTIAIGMLPLYIVLLFAAPYLLRLWLQDSFVEAMPVAFQVMLVVVLIRLFGTPAENLIIGLGHVGAEFFARCIEWLFVFGLILSIAIIAGQLSPLIATICFVPATLLATLSRTLSARKVMSKRKAELNDLSLIHTADRIG